MKTFVTDSLSTISITKKCIIILLSKYYNQDIEIIYADHFKYYYYQLLVYVMIDYKE